MYEDLLSRYALYVSLFEGLSIIKPKSYQEWLKTA